MKRFIRHALCLIYGIMLCQLSLSQELTLITKVPFEPIQVVSSNKQGDVFIATERGDIKKLNSLGEVTLYFSPDKPGTVTLLESWNSLRSFVFYAGFQEYLFLDRFLTPTVHYTLEDYGSGYISMAAISADNNIWAFDNTTFRLLKFDTNFRQIIIETPLEFTLDPLNYEINFMREYQNLLFVNDKVTGILIFDNLGNFLRKIAGYNVSFFSFEGDELYFVDGDKLHFVNIYDANLTSTIDLSGSPQSDYVLVLKGKVFLFNDEEIAIYQYK